MTSYTFLVVVHMCVIACGLVAGVFLTFSDFVMKSLAATDTAGGIQAMQNINEKVMPTLFMVLLLGISAAAPVLGVYAYLSVPFPSAVWIIAGCLAYCFGVFLVTVIFNVPMNNRLARLQNTAPEAAVYWRHYLRRWSAWNHVRTLASGAAAVCFLIGASSLAGAA